MNYRISALQNLTFSTICIPKIQEKQKTPVTLWVTGVWYI